MKWRGRKGDAYKVLVGNDKGTDYIEDLNVDGRIILKCILQQLLIYLLTHSTEQSPS
jgi:hypothetical protein